MNNQEAIERLEHLRMALPLPKNAEEVIALEAAIGAMIPPPNDPLTPDELREMDGEPVWCESEHRPDGAGWFLVDASALQPHEFIAVGRERGIPCAGIDTGYWLAYRRKPEEGTA